MGKEPFEPRPTLSSPSPQPPSRPSVVGAGTESLLKDGFSSDAMAPTLIGIIGGSALGDAFELEEEQAKFLMTPHGAPSDPPRVGRHAGVPVAFLARHGKDHRKIGRASCRERV